jgi:NOL1/NOP2/fmu family ribosome biogenesis protein
MIRLVYNSEKKKILKQLNEQYGITELPFTLIRTGKQKIRGYSGDLTNEEICLLNETAKIEIIGLYLFSDHYEQGLRLSVDALHIFKDQIIKANKNILSLNDKQLKEWFRGEDLLLKDEWKELPRTFKTIMYKGEFVGSAKLTDSKLINYLPKERRVKDPNVN